MQNIRAQHDIGGVGGVSLGAQIGIDVENAVAHPRMSSECCPGSTDEEVGDIGEEVVGGQVRECVHNGRGGSRDPRAHLDDAQRLPGAALRAQSRDLPKRGGGELIDGATDLVLAIDRVRGPELALGEQDVSHVELAAQQVAQARGAGVHEVQEL